MLVIVKTGTSSETASEDIETGELKSYSNGTQNPYITAYLKLDTTNYLNFVIGKGEKYEFRNKTYFNQRLKQNSHYIMFLRFFESEVIILYIFWTFTI